MAVVLLPVVVVVLLLLLLLLLLLVALTKHTCPPSLTPHTPQIHAPNRAVCCRRPPHCNPHVMSDV